MNIGIFGGTFNPIHNGHISLAEQLLGKGILDKVLFMVSARPPHKNEPQVSPEERLEMVRLALSDKENMEPCDLEFKRAGNSYTVDTMAEIRTLYKEDKVFFVLGADSFVQLPDWKEPERLFKEVAFIVSDRSCAFEDAEYQRKVTGIMEKYHPDVQFFPLATPDVSSTELRSGNSTEHLPELVLAYIKRNKLYE